MIDPAVIDRILEAAPIEEVIGEYVSLKRRGANYTACCPFHSEKTPSFSVSPSKGIYKCFGCGKAGNAITFLRDHEQMSYIEAVKYLGNKYHITIEEEEETPQQAAGRMRRESLMVVNDYAQEFFTHTLWEDPMGRAVGLAYFRERGFSDETIKRFGLGYAPKERDAFTRSALSKGYQLELLTATGLTLHYSANETQPEAVADRYRDRVIFPIHSLSGRIIAFGGRTLRTDKQTAKYINSPESELYVKSRSLYGIYFAKSEMTRLQHGYLVEGYTDVISLYQSGIKNVVASSGTSLTTEQIRLLKRFAPQVTVLYDGDSAGIKASIRGIDMLLEEGLQVKVVRFPETEDPDSFARTHTPEDTRTFLETNQTDFIRFKISLFAQDMADPMQRSSLVHQILQSVAVVPDPIARSLYIQECAQQLQMEASLLTREVARLRKAVLSRRRAAESFATTWPSQDPHLPEEAPLDPATGADASALTWEETTPTAEEVPRDIVQAEHDLLYFLIKYGQLPYQEGLTVAAYIENELQNDDLEFRYPLYATLYRLYYQLSGDNAHRYRQLIGHPDPHIVQEVVDLLNQPHPLTVKSLVESLPLEETLVTLQVTKAVLVFKALTVSHAYTELTLDLKDAQQAGDTAHMEALMHRMKVLMDVRNYFAKELNRLNG